MQGNRKVLILLAVILNSCAQMSDSPFDAAQGRPTLRIDQFAGFFRETGQDEAESAQKRSGSFGRDRWWP
jgi:hypothetical protein